MLDFESLLIVVLSVKISWLMIVLLVETIVPFVMAVLPAEVVFGGVELAVVLTDDDDEEVGVGSCDR